MAYPADYTDSDSSDKDSWAFDDTLSEGELTPEEYYFLWRRPNTYELVPKFQALIRDYPEGLRLKDFQDAYFKKFHCYLDCTNYGYKTLLSLIMDYSDVLECIREGTGPDGWLTIDATRPPTEEEKTTLSMRLNPELVLEIKTNIAFAVAHYYKKTEAEKELGLPVEKLQTVYEELFGALVRYEVLGFDSLKSLCLAIDGEGFRVCKIDARYMLMPPATPWHWFEAPPAQPFLGPLPEGVVIPKDMAGPDATLYHLDYTRHIKAGELMDIIIEKYEDPGNFSFRLKTFDPLLQKFKEGLVEFYGRDSNYRMPNQLMRPGQVCAVSSYCSPRLPGVWDRGRVLELLNGGRVNVLLVDSGKTTTVYSNRVKFLHKQFLSFPVQIIPGCLAGVIPREPNYDNWSRCTFEEHVRQPYLVAEAHSPDYHRPMIPLIVFSRYSTRSVNRILVDSYHNRLKPTVPFCILTRKTCDEIRINEMNPEQLIRRSRAWQMEEEPLVSDSDSQTDDEEWRNQCDMFDLDNILAIRDDAVLPFEFPMSPPVNIPEPDFVVDEPGPSRRRTRGPSSRRRKQSSRSPARPDPLPLKKNQQSAKARSNPNTVKEENASGEKAKRKRKDKRNRGKKKIEKSASSEQKSPPIEEPFKGCMERDPRLQEIMKNWDTNPEKKKNQNMPQGKASGSKTTPSPSPAVKKENEKSKPKKNSAAESKISVAYPSTSKAALEAENASFTVEIRGASTSKQDQNTKKGKTKKLEKSKVKDKNATKNCHDKNCDKLKEETDSESNTESNTIGSRSYTATEKSSGTSETSGTSNASNVSDASDISANDDNFKVGALRLINPEDAYCQSRLGYDMNKLIMEFLSWNPIIQEVGQENPGLALRIATLWAHYALLSNDDEMLDAKNFNPFALVTEEENREPLKRTLTLMLPDKIYDKYFSLAAVSPSEGSDEPSLKGDSSNGACQSPTTRDDFPVKVVRTRQDPMDDNMDNSNDDEIAQAMPPEEEEDEEEVQEEEVQEKVDLGGFQPREAIVEMEKLNTTNKRRYKVTIDGRTYFCTKDEIKVIINFPNAETGQNLKKYGMSIFRWLIVDQREQSILEEFERLFVRYVILLKRYNELQKEKAEEAKAENREDHSAYEG